MKVVGLGFALGSFISAQAVAEVPDIVGLRLGMTWAEAKIILAERGASFTTPLYTISVSGDVKLADKYGYPYQINLQMTKGNELFKISLYPKSTAVKLSNPTNLIVHRVFRSFGYKQDKAPDSTTSYTNLTAKYGPANEGLNQGFQKLVSWLPHETSTLDATALAHLPLNDARSNRPYKCYSSPDVYGAIEGSEAVTSQRPAAGFDLSSWQGWQSCGLVVRAQIHTSQNDLVQSITQDLLDFGQFDMVAAAKNAAEQQIKTRIAADSKAAAPQQAF
jgi:hypothetical protein